MNRLDVVSLFSGIGLVDVAAEAAGMRTLLLCEKDKACRKVLAVRFPNAVIHEDVTELSVDDLRAAGAVPGRTVLTAGWPCQGNSVAGKRGGMADQRSGLWRHVARLLREFQPAWFVGENVPGLLSVNGGRDFATVVQDLAELGYGFSSRVLDARYFGVPQRRRRVVIVGHLGDSGAAPAEVLLEPESVRRDSPQVHEAWPRATSRARESVAVGVLGHHTHALTAEGADASEDGTGRGTPVIAFHLTPDPISGNVSPAMGTGNAQGCATIGVVYAPDRAATLTAGVSSKGVSAPGRRQEDDTNLIAYVAPFANALDTAQGGPDDNSAQGGHLVAFAENQRGEIVESDTMGALKTGGGKPGQGYPAITDGVIVRRLTPLECERLQGAADRWTDVESASDSARYKELGNSVAVPVFAWTFGRLASVDARLRSSSLSVGVGKP